jgi:hypothetical protein
LVKGADDGQPGGYAQEGFGKKKMTVDVTRPISHFDRWSVSVIDVTPIETIAYQ